jgi:hypothetical protein
VDSNVAQRVAKCGADVAGNPPVRRPPTAAGCGDRGFDLRVHDAAGEDPVAVTHAGDRPSETTVADRRGDPRQRLRALRLARGCGNALALGG